MEKESDEKFQETGGIVNDLVKSLKKKISDAIKKANLENNGIQVNGIEIDAPDEIINQEMLQDLIQLSQLIDEDISLQEQYSEKDFLNNIKLLSVFLDKYLEIFTKKAIVYSKFYNLIELDDFESLVNEEIACISKYMNTLINLRLLNDKKKKTIEKIKNEIFKDFVKKQIAKIFSIFKDISDPINGVYFYYIFIRLCNFARKNASKIDSIYPICDLSYDMTFDVIFKIPKEMLFNNTELILNLITASGRAKVYADDESLNPRRTAVTAILVNLFNFLKKTTEQTKNGVIKITNQENEESIKAHQKHFRDFTQYSVDTVTQTILFYEATNPDLKLNLLREFLHIFKCHLDGSSIAEHLLKILIENLNDLESAHKKILEIPEDLKDNPYLEMTFFKKYMEEKNLEDNVIYFFIDYQYSFNNFLIELLEKSFSQIKSDEKIDRIFSLIIEQYKAKIATPKLLTDLIFKNITDKHELKDVNLLAKELIKIINARTSVIPINSFNEAMKKLLLIKNCKKILECPIKTIKNFESSILSFEKKISTIKRLASQLSIDKRKLSEKIKELENEKETLISESTKKQSHLDRELTEKKEAILKLKKEISEKLTSIEELKKNLNDAIEKNLKEKENLKQLEKEKQFISKELIKAEKKLKKDEISSLQRAKTTLFDQNTSLKNKISSLENEIKSLTEKISLKKDALSKDNQEVIEKNNLLKKEIELLTKKTSKKNKDAEKLLEEISKIKENLRREKALKDDLNEKRQHLLKKHAALQKSKNHLERNFSHLSFRFNETISRLRAELKDSDLKRMFIRQHHEKTLEQNKFLIYKIEELEQQNQNLLFSFQKMQSQPFEQLSIEESNKAFELGKRISIEHIDLLRSYLGIPILDGYLTNNIFYPHLDKNIFPFISCGERISLDLCELVIKSCYKIINYHHNFLSTNDDKFMPNPSKGIIIKCSHFFSNSLNDMLSANPSIEYLKYFNNARVLATNLSWLNEYHDVDSFSIYNAHHLFFSPIKNTLTSLSNILEKSVIYFESLQLPKMKRVEPEKKENRMSIA